ncbi:hypothetical protein GCM10027610_056160 [Dactylosporangium cerinum]
MSHETLRNWVRRQDPPAQPQGAAAGVGLSVADKDAEIAVPRIAVSARNGARSASRFDCAPSSIINA